jgi:hypothetical protein
MSNSVFDVALEKRFADSPEIATIDVTSGDTLLIRDSATGAVMRMPFSTLSAAISLAFASSFASLVDGKVPASQLPSFVDDVLEYANLAAFPATGESGKIYVAIDTNKTYRWSGSAYVEISQSLALGETSSTAYRGDRGKTAYDHSQATGNPHGTTKSDVGLSSVTNDAQLKIASNLSDLNNAVTARSNLGVPASASPVMTGRETLSVDTKDIWYRKVFRLAVSTWTTIATFNPSGGANEYLSGFIEVRASGYLVSNSNSGANYARWYYNVINGVVTVSQVGTDVSAGTFPPKIRLVEDTGTIKVQVESNNTTYNQYITAFVQAFLISGFINATSWTITD